MRDRIAIIDISEEKFKVLSYKQYDKNNLLQIVIIENKNIVNISNYIVTVYFELPSGKTYKKNGTIENNTINVILTSGILSECGKVIVEVELSNAYRVVTTFSMYLNIEESISKPSEEEPDSPDTPNNPSIADSIPNIEVLRQITQEKINEWNNKSDFDGNYDSLINKPNIPTKTSQLENDSNFATKDYVDNKSFSGSSDDHYLGEEEPTNDNAIWFSNETNYQQEITYDNPIIQEIFASLRSLKKAVTQLQSDVEYLKANGGGNTPEIPDIPDIPDTTDNYFFLLEDGGQLLLEDGSYLVLEDYIEQLTQSILTLEDGSSLLLEDGSYILLEETIQEIQESLMLLEDGAQLLLENGYKIILER